MHLPALPKVAFTSTPRTKTLPHPSEHKSLAGDPESVGTPERKKPLCCIASVYSNWRTAVRAAASDALVDEDELAKVNCRFQTGCFTNQFRAKAILHTAMASAGGEMQNARILR